MNLELKRVLAELAHDRPEGLTLVPSSPRQLAEALQILASQHAALHKDVRLSVEALDKVGKVEPRGGTLEVGAGVELSVLEHGLTMYGLTLGPLSPRALELTLSEFLEGPDAGLRAIPGGRLEPLCLAVTAVLPDGRVHRSHPSPRSAAGPDLVALLLGGAGRMAVITDAIVRCFPLPTCRRSQVFSFPSAEAFVAAIHASLADGVWFQTLRVETRADRAQVEVQLLGTADGVERDFATLGRRAFDVGGRASGRLSGEFPIAATPEAPWAEREATWDSVREAVTAQRPLALYRLSLASVIVRGDAVGCGFQQPTPWPAASAALVATLDPRGVLGGAP